MQSVFSVAARRWSLLVATTTVERRAGALKTLCIMLCSSRLGRSEPRSAASSHPAQQVTLPIANYSSAGFLAAFQPFAGTFISRWQEVQNITDV
jgi:hypothetical protein